MQKKGLENYFEKYLNKKPFFVNREVLQSPYTPEAILHRDGEINQVASALAPALRLEQPSNLFIYGKTGTGKTLCTHYVTSQIKNVSKNKKIPVQIFYVNCKLKKVADTEYRLLAHLCRELGKEIPPTGLPTEEIYRLFFNSIDSTKQQVILILDEIDQLVKKTGDEVLYNLTRINSELEQSNVSIIGISNEISFIDNLDPRIKSSLSEEEIMFAPYNAIQLQHILKNRAKLAFRKECMGQGVIEKCAAYAARGHGDARRALELLRVAGELAERETAPKLRIKHLDKALEKIERDKIMEVIMAQPKQYHAVLYSILKTPNKTNRAICTGGIYNFYKELCTKTAIRPLTQRRVSDIILEFDISGIINTHVVSKGRYGRTKEVNLLIPTQLIPKVKKTLKENLGL